MLRGRLGWVLLAVAVTACILLLTWSDAPEHHVDEINSEAGENSTAQLLGRATGSGGQGADVSTDQTSGVLRGLVTDVHERPVEDVLLVLSDLETQQEFARWTSKTGQFEARIPEPSGAFALVAAKAGWASSRRAPVHAGQFVRLQLRSSARLVVRLKSPRSESLRATKVRVGVRGSGESIHWLESADQKGVATFDGLPRGSVLIVSAAHPHHGLARTSVELASDQTQECWLEFRKADVVSGRVIDDESGDPISGARVGLHIKSLKGTKSITGIDGTFIVAIPVDLSRAAARIAVLADGYVTEFIDADSGDRAEVRLRLGAALQGRVLLGDERVPMARVRATRLMGEQANGWEVVDAQAETDELGEFRLIGLSPGAPYVIEAAAPGAGSALVMIPTLRTDEELVLHLESPSAIVGQLTNGKGVALASARVTLERSLPGPMSLLTRGRSHHPHVSRRNGLTDENGLFLFEGLTAGRFHLSASDGDNWVFKTVTLTAETRSTQDLKIAPPPGAERTVRVLLPNEKAAAGVRVEVVGEKRFTWRTNREGLALVTVAGRRAAITVRTEPGATWLPPPARKLQDFDAVETIVIRLRDRTTVSGAIRTASDESLANLVVVAMRGQTEVDRVVSDRAGRFQLQMLGNLEGIVVMLQGTTVRVGVNDIEQSPSPWRGSVSGPFGDTDVLIVAERDPETARLTVRVKTPMGKPAAGCRVTLYVQGTAPWSRTTDSTGLATFDVKQQASGRLRARPDPVRAAASGHWEARMWSGPIATDMEVVMRLTQAHEVFGTVTGEQAPSAIWVRASHGETWTALIAGVEFRIWVPRSAFPLELRAVNAEGQLGPTAHQVDAGGPVKLTMPEPPK